MRFLNLFVCFTIVRGEQSDDRPHSGSFGSGIGTGSGLGSGSCVGDEWQYTVRYQAEAKLCEKPLYLNTDRGLTKTLPHVGIEKVGYYFSRFFNEDLKPQAMVEYGIPFKSDERIDWMKVNPDMLYLALMASGISSGYATGLKALLVAAQWSDFLYDAFALAWAKLRDGGWLDSDHISHKFVVVELADGRYCSIEKYCDYIDVRCSTMMESVVDFQIWTGDSMCLKRTSPRLYEKFGWSVPYEPMTLNEQAAHLATERNRPYYLLLDNCQHFAQRLWNELTLDPEEVRKFMRDDL